MAFPLRDHSHSEPANVVHYLDRRPAEPDEEGSVRGDPAATRTALLAFLAANLLCWGALAYAAVRYFG